MVYCCFTHITWNSVNGLECGSLTICGSTGIGKPPILPKNWNVTKRNFGKLHKITQICLKSEIFQIWGCFLPQFEPLFSGSAKSENGSP